MNKLRVLIAHNRYRQQGGEDIVAEQEAALLERYGHPVERFSRDNHELKERSLRTALDTVWSRETVASVARLVDRFRPDVIHVHNTFPLISPSLYWEASRRGIPVVQTLHNFRLLCPQAMFLRNGRVCEDCVGHLPWRAAAHACYRDSTAQSAVVATMLSVHRFFGTYRKKIARYIALNDFCRDKFAQGGLPADRIAVKPNFVDIDAPDRFEVRNGALFVGRLSQEKGIGVLLDALNLSQSLRIDVIGDGPERNRVSNHARIAYRGRKELPEILEAMRSHSYLVLPSIWYENAPRTLIEAFGCGLPVIASRLGALAELIRHGETGLLFDPGDANSLAQTLTWAHEHPQDMLKMGKAARLEFEERYTSERNYVELLGIYRGVVTPDTVESAYVRALS